MCHSTAHLPHSPRISRLVVQLRRKAEQLRRESRSVMYSHSASIRPVTCMYLETCIVPDLQSVHSDTQTAASRRPPAAGHKRLNLPIPAQARRAPAPTAYRGAGAGAVAALIVHAAAHSVHKRLRRAKQWVVSKLPLLHDVFLFCSGSPACVCLLFPPSPVRMTLRD